jgi:hypothetical protein
MNQESSAPVPRAPLLSTFTRASPLFIHNDSAKTKPLSRKRQTEENNPRAGREKKTLQH